MSGVSRLVSAIEASDYFRRSPAQFDDAERGHKEWLHFCISAEDVDVLVNASVVDDLRPTMKRGSEQARLSVLAHQHQSGWSGAIELYAGEDVHVRGGAVEIRLGASRIAFEEGAYRLQVRMPRADISADLRLEPVTFPSLVNNVRGLDGRPINWAVVPRSRATGALRVRGRTYELQNALAYHDHNWGRFGWGNNFAWEWGYGLPREASNPFTMVFARLNDRPNTSALMQLFFLWKDERLFCTYRDHDIEVFREGLLRPSRLVKLPPTMGLVSPWRATDVPERLRFRVRSRQDELMGVFTAGDVAQVIIPNDDDFGVTIINEVSGTLSVSGKALGERVEIENRAVFEFLSA